ncbi:MAG: hydrolase [Actinomycetes bacterium]|jgi:predicted hydrolase (HD superfamily)|nr:hydrolase [Actinomycetes bacterium]
MTDTTNMTDATGTTQQELSPLPLDDAGAEALLDAHNPNPALQRHGRAVRGVMRHLARKCGTDPDWWGQVGLLHDLDYEQHPDEHCAVTPQLLRDAGYGEDFIHAVTSHGWGMCPDSPEPAMLMENYLYAADELAGLVNAAVLMRPDRSIYTIEPKSVRKKFKTKGFAVGVDRTVITAGCERLGIELNDLIADVIAGMREVAADIDLVGECERSTPDDSETEGGQ